MNIGVAFACERVSGKAFLSKERFAINEIGLLKKVFNSFNTLVGLLRGFELWDRRRINLGLVAVGSV